MYFIVDLFKKNSGRRNNIIKTTLFIKVQPFPRKYLMQICKFKESRQSAKINAVRGPAIKLSIRTCLGGGIHLMPVFACQLVEVARTIPCELRRPQRWRINSSRSFLYKSVFPQNCLKSRTHILICYSPLTHAFGLAETCALIREIEVRIYVIDVVRFHLKANVILSELFVLCCFFKKRNSLFR